MPFGSLLCTGGLHPFDTYLKRKVSQIAYIPHFLASQSQYQASSRMQLRIYHVPGYKSHGGGSLKVLLHRP